MDNILSRHESELLEWYGGPEYVRHKHRDALEAWLNEPAKSKKRDRRNKKPSKKPSESSKPSKPSKQPALDIYSDEAWDKFCNQTERREL